MLSISLWNQKGGVGKTTISIQLAGYFSSIHHCTVLVVDLDDQKSSTEIINQNKMTNVSVVNDYPSSKPDCDVLIVDHPPGTKKIPKTRKVIVPFRPSSIDFKAVIRSIKFLKSKDRIVIPIISCFQGIKSEHRSTQRYVSKNFEKFGVIKNRSIYERSVGKGMSVYNKQIQNLYGIAEARQEIKKLSRCIGEDYEQNSRVVG